MENDIHRLDEKINGDDQVDIIDYTNKLADSIQKKIDDIIMSGDTNAEVVDARGEFNTLGNRLDNVDKNIVISTKPFETNCDIEDSANSKIKFDKIIGGLVQEGEPSLANPSELKYVGGNYDIEVSNSDESEKRIYPVDLSNRNLLNYQDFTLIDSGFIINNLSLPLSRGKYVFSFDFAGFEASAELGTAATSKAFTVRNGRNILFYDNIDSSDRFTFYSNGAGTYSNFMLTKGTQELSYQPYVTPYNYPLYSEKDYIYKKDNKWYVHNEWGKYVFTGNEAFAQSIEGFFMTFSGFDRNDTTIFCNILKNYKDYNEFISSDYGISILYNEVNNLYFRNKDVSSISELQSILKGNYFIYKLATPTETEIQGESALVEAELLYTQLEALYNMKTYKGGTHITFDDIGKIQGEYIVDNGLAEAVQEFNEINGYVDEARVIELINQYK